MGDAVGQEKREKDFAEVGVGQTHAWVFGDPRREDGDGLPIEIVEQRGQEEQADD